MAQVSGTVPGIAEKLFRMGYKDLVSVEPGGKKPAMWANGKWAGYSWNEEQNVLFATVMDNHKSNIGIRARNFPGLDIDSDHQGLTDLVLGVAGSALPILQAPVRLSRGSRRLFMFRTAEPFKKKRLTVTTPTGETHGIEFLGDGQQYVIHGGHPSGSKYRFEEHAKLPGHPAELPTVTEADVDAFFEALKDTLEAQGLTCSMGSTPAGQANPLPDEIPHGERSDRLTQMGGAMRRQGASYDEILLSLSNINENRCSPPMRDERVEGVARSVMRYDADPDELPTKAADVFESQEVSDKPKFKMAFEMVNADEAIATDYEEITWLLDEWVPAFAGYTLLNSKPKVGKSTFARAFAVAVSNGTDFLGKKTIQGPVMYVSFPFEGDERRNALKLKKMGKAAPNMWISKEWEKGLTRDDVIQTVAHHAERFQPKLIVIDTIMKMLRMKDGNDYNEIQEVLEPLYHVVKPWDCHFLFVHHDKKGGVDDVIESGLGSIGLAGNAETVIRLERDQEFDKMRVIDGRGRDAGDIDPQILRMDPETEEPYLGGSVQHFKDQELEATILACLGEVEDNEPMTSEQIRVSIGKRRTEVERVLGKSGAVVKSGTAKRGDPICWALSNPHDVFKPEEVSGADGSADDQE